MTDPVREVWVEFNDDAEPVYAWLREDEAIDTLPSGWKLRRFVAAEPGAAEGWVPWTQEAAEELQEETSAWIDYRGVVQKRPYTWLFDEEGTGYWFCAAPDGESQMKNDGVRRFLPITAPSHVAEATGDDTNPWELLVKWLAGDAKERRLGADTSRFTRVQIWAEAHDDTAAVGGGQRGAATSRAAALDLCHKLGLLAHAPGSK